MTLDDMKDVREVMKNLAQVAALAAGSGIVKRIRERRDRSADMLLKLEERFDKPEIEKAGDSSNPMIGRPSSRRRR